jgi:hypothetical protein
MNRKMLTGPRSRREFLLTSGALTIGAGLTLSLEGCRDAAGSAADAIRNGDGPRVLTDAERRSLEALADRILPPDGASPGAAAMGAVVFMDHYAAAHPAALQGLRGGVAALDARAQALQPGAAGFAELDQPAAEGLLAAMSKEAPGDFQLLQLMVLSGAFAAPARGGNRDESGWALVGYDDRHSWQPPFGFYDAAATRGAGG